MSYAARLDRADQYLVAVGLINVPVILAQLSYQVARDFVILEDAVQPPSLRPGDTVVNVSD
jgi:hypothetical protein